MLGLAVKLGKFAFAIFFIVLAGLAWSQSPSDTISSEDSEQLLIRFQEIKGGEFSCLVLQRDNTFHIEHNSGNKIDIREGILSQNALVALQTLLADQHLAALSQTQVKEPLMDQELHAEIALNIHRLPGPAGWQNLLFRTAESARAFKSEMAPFQRWFDSLRNEPHTSLTEEEGRNNCRVGKRELKSRPETNSLVPFPTDSSGHETFLFRAVISQSFSQNFGNRLSFENRVERTCIIVYPKGGYHLEVVSQRVHESAQRSVFEDILSEAELTGLRQLLDDPGLVASTHRKRPPDVPVHEVDFTSVFIARPGGIQTLEFGTFSVSRGYRASDKSDTSKDTAVIQPIRNWIKKSIEKRGVPANPQGVTNNCEVQR